MSLVMVHLNQPTRRYTTSADELIGINLKARRKAAGITQMAAADALGISWQQYQKYESGKNRLSASRLAAVAEIFRCSPLDILDLEAAERTPLPDVSPWEMDMLKGLRTISVRQRTVIKSLITELARDQ